MAFTVQLIEGSEDPINLYYLADDGWSMLDKGFEPNDPERRELWGGWLETILTRQEDGKRTIPLRFYMEQSTVDVFIDGVNALEERLRHAARYRYDGWGDEVFLRFQLHNSTYGVDFPVCSGGISKADLMNICNGPMDGTGHREITRMNSIGVTLVCEPYWEATDTYTLENYIDNPGFWRGVVAPGDSWTEFDPAGNLALAWDTTIYEVMGRSLEWTISHDAVNAVGIMGDAIAVAASTDYYFELRGFSTAGCDTVEALIEDLSHGVALVGTELTFDNQDDAWEKLGVAFTTPVGCISIRPAMYRYAAHSTAGDKTFYCDAFYLEPRSDAPTGWSSGRNLVNCLDDTADNINVLCVTEIPGEAEAEIKLTIDLGAVTTDLRVAKRTRDVPANFLWELNPCEAFTTAEGGAGGACTPGLTDASCIDSDKIIDGTSPTGSRIQVSFAGNQSMRMRCYWDLTSNLQSYNGKYVILVVAKMSGATDTATMTVYWYDDVANYMGGTEGVDILGAANWKLWEGWEIFAFPIGGNDANQFGAGNNRQIRLYAETDGTPTDSLQIAAAYLVAVDEAYSISGSPGLAATFNFILKEMDGDRGFFPYSTASDTHYPGMPCVGRLPLLEPRIENWLYFILCGATANSWVYNDPYSVSLNYRPRGIFLRGSNP